MKFVDEYRLHAKAGSGGNGIVSWYRSRREQKGGPAGGDGGKGGDVYFRAVRDLNYLSKYTYNQKFEAQNGGDGMKAEKEGANGNDLYIDVPIGSKIKNLTNGDVFSLLEEGQVMKVLSGGKGGFGNTHFKSSRNTSPMEQTDGKPGEEADFYIELQLLVDLGLVGLPSAGKSSLLNSITNAKSKVAEYHFTTLEPYLGVFHKKIIADIPGLIEGASEGKGLGYKFLRHIKRTKHIAHLVSFESYDEKNGCQKMMENYDKIRNELIKYSPEISEKKELIILSQSDRVSDDISEKVKKEFEKKYNKEVVVLSIIDDEKINNFEKVLSNFLAK